MRYVASALVLGALLLALAPPASGQDFGGRYTVTVLGGWTSYDGSSAIEDAWTGGLEAQYNFSDNVGLGIYLMAARPTTDAGFFPLVRMEFSDTVYNYLVSQQVTQFDYGLSATVRYPMGQFYVRGLAGVGFYTFDLDDQRIQSPTVPGELKDSFTELSFNFGAVAAYRFSEIGALEFRLRDFVYTDYDRDRFSVSEPLLGAPDVPHPEPDKIYSEKKDTIHNIHIELGFSFTLGGR